MNNPVLHMRDVERFYEQAGEKLHVLKGCSLDVYGGDQVALIGPSGSGKSTLLHIAGLLEKPTAGQLIIDGFDASTMEDAQRTLLRRKTIGFVYQFHHLLPEFSACENIMLPQMLAGVDRVQARKRAMELLDLVELTQRADHRPARLSGGEQQRVALVRALANQPKILIADEPTGNLDPSTADMVFSYLQMLVQTQNLALLMATHNHELAGRMGAVVEIRDGVLASL